MIHLCTLFDSNYIDRGLTMYHSLIQACPSFHLYVFAFDEKCYQVLSDMNLSHLTLIPLSDFETPELLAVKPFRSRGEYCWTCSSFTIYHVIKYFNVDYCTYIDADMYFYNDPNILLQEIKASDCQVSIVKHEFGHNSYARRSEKINGKYCVQFNTFRNTAESLHILRWWGEKCLEDCNANYDNGNFGDQKYLSDWTTRFQGVHELSHLGAGVANWNLYRYRMINYTDFTLYDQVTKAEFPLIFFHFHGLAICSDSINTGVYTSYGRKDELTIKRIYNSYLISLLHNRSMLREKYGLFSEANAVQFSAVTSKTFKEKIDEKKDIYHNWGLGLMIYMVIKSHYLSAKDIIPIASFLEEQ